MDNLHLEYIIERLTAISDNIEYSEFLKQHGWAFSSIPYKIIAPLIEKQETVKIEEINKIIVEYFAENDSHALKSMIESWNEIEAFIKRQHIFEEAFKTHETGCYLVSTSFLSLHIEGVLSDFARQNLGNGRYKTCEAVTDIGHEYSGATLGDIIQASDEKSVSFTYVNFQNLEETNKVVENFLNQRFDPANPDNCKETDSRNRNSHGHMIEKKDITDSLKKFFTLNELYNYFVIVDSMTKASNSPTQSSDCDMTNEEIHQ